MEQINQNEKEQEEQTSEGTIEVVETVKPFQIDENYDTTDVPYGC